MNLGLNAVQAIGKETGWLHVKSRLVGGAIIIEVKDSGGGIEPENLSHIFDPFFTTKDVGEGTGLGLSVSQSLVAQMGGDITVKSDPGVGTCFTLIIPINSNEEQ
jgi:signal transduction histidine kinase